MRIGLLTLIYIETFNVDKSTSYSRAYKQNFVTDTIDKGSSTENMTMTEALKFRVFRTPFTNELDSIQLYNIFNIVKLLFIGIIIFRILRSKKLL